MAANTNPIFVATPIIQSSGSMTAANTDTTMTTGTSYYILQAGSNGGKVEQVTVIAAGTTTACLVRLFVCKTITTGSAGNNMLVLEIPVAANTESQTGANVAVTVTTNIYLQANYYLYATLSVSQSAPGIIATAQGGSF